MKAVVLESSRLYQRLISKIFSAFDLDVAIYDNGSDALADIAANKPEVVCISMHLSDMTGIEVCQKIRSMGGVYQRLPVLIITSEDNPDTLSKALIAGATDILQKDEADSIEMRLRIVLPQYLVKRHSGRILYLEDSQVAANITRQQLNRIGLSMDHASTVHEALRYVKNNEYDLLITDIVLQETLSGLDFIKEIRANSELDHTAILAITAIDDVSRRVAILKAGANDYLIKPIIEDEFYARINNLLESKKLFDQLKRERKRLLEMATKDALTTLYNRHFLLETAQRKFAEAYRQRYPLSIMVLDIDHFKKINDSLGHSGGDKVLKAVAEVLKKYFREEDIVARIGGEEFVVMLAHSDEKNTFARAEELRKQIEQLNPEGWKTTVSIGITTLNLAKKETFDDLFNRADKALYQSKGEGRNRVIEAVKGVQVVAGF